MKGKVFSSSQNLYQDQAKVLFEYYKDAAEKIVSQEETLEKEIRENEQMKLTETSSINQKKIGMIAGFAAGVLLIAAGLFLPDYLILLIIAGIVGVGLGINYLLKVNKVGKILAEADRKIAELQEKHKNIFRDYKVEKLGVVYVPVASQIPFENKSFLVDHTNSMPNQQFELQIVRDQANLTSKIKELRTLSRTAPLVENSEETETVDTDNYSLSIQKITYHDYFSKMDRTLRVCAQCLADLQITSVNLPVVQPDSQYASYLNEFATADTGGAPVLNVFDTHKYDKEIADFNALNEMRRSLARQSEQFEDVLRRLIKNVGMAIQTISALKVASGNKLVDKSNQLLFNILKASYNHYSPVLEHEEIDKIRNEDFNFSDSVESYSPFQLKESSRVRYDMISGTWVAEDGSQTTTPFGISQIQEEIVAPIVQNLLMESRVERLRIYNNIKDQKINYLNQWHQDTEDFYGRNRASSDDLRNLMRSNLTKFMAAQTTLASLEQMKNNMRKQSVESGKDSSLEALAAFKMQSEQFERIQEDFEEYMNRLKDDIDERAEKFGYIEYYDASLRDKTAKDTVEAGDHVAELDERRKPLAIINPLYAKTSAIPPRPSVESIVDEHLSLNLATMAQVALQELDQQEEELHLTRSTTDYSDDEEEDENSEKEEIIPEEENIPETDVLEEEEADGGELDDLDEIEEEEL